MTDGEDLYEAIIAAPHDDTLRLIYADWLEETGDANSIKRAFYIRHEIKRLTSGIYEIIPNPDQQWMDYPSEVNVYWSRGFPAHFECKMDYWISNGRSLCRKYPIETVFIEDKNPYRISEQNWRWHCKLEPEEHVGSCYIEQDYSIDKFIYLQFGAKKRDVSYKTKKEAKIALSFACLKWARLT